MHGARQLTTIIFGLSLVTPNIIDVEQSRLSQRKAKEIVATSFWNRATPFIRYQTNDLAFYKSDHCEVCGRHFDIFSKIEGRKGDFFVGRDRNLISLTALVYGQHFKAFKNIKNIQFVQTIPGKVQVKIEPGKIYTPENSLEIKSSLENAAHGQLTAEIELVDQIDRTTRGKNKVLDQQVDINELIH